MSSFIHFPNPPSSPNVDEHMFEEFSFNEQTNVFFVSSEIKGRCRPLFLVEIISPLIFFPFVKYVNTA